MPRALPVKVVVKIESVDGDDMAAPNPCMARPRSIWDRLVDTPSTIEPTMKREIPAMKIRFLPNSSLSFPHVNRNEPKIRE